MRIYLNETTIIIFITGIAVLLILWFYKKFINWYQAYHISRLPKHDLYKRMHLQSPDVTFYDVYELMHVKARTMIDDMTHRELVLYIENISEELI